MSFFNPAEHEPAQEFALIPPGVYKALIEHCEVKDTRNGGQFVAVTLMILGPTHANRKVFDNITFANSNKEAERIGHGQLSLLCRCANGDDRPISSERELINKVVGIKIFHRKDKGYNEMRERVSYLDEMEVAEANNEKDKDLPF